MQQFPRDSAFSDNKDSTCLLTERFSGNLFPIPVSFPWYHSSGSFSDSGISPVGAECCLVFQQFSFNGKSRLSCKSGSGCHCLVQMREAFALESRKAQLFLGHHLGVFHLLLQSKAAIAAKDYKFPIPGTKHVDMFSHIHSRPAN